MLNCVARWVSSFVVKSSSNSVYFVVAVCVLWENKKVAQIFQQDYWKNMNFWVQNMTGD
jgi:hypothetical protein